MENACHLCDGSAEMLLDTAEPGLPLVDASAYGFASDVPCKIGQQLVEWASCSYSLSEIQDFYCNSCVCAWRLLVVVVCDDFSHTDIAVMPLPAAACSQDKLYFLVVLALYTLIRLLAVLQVMVPAGHCAASSAAAWPAAAPAAASGPAACHADQTPSLGSSRP